MTSNDPTIQQLQHIGAPIVVATHPRSGTHLLMDTLRRNCPECVPTMLPLETPADSYFSIDRFDEGHHRPVTHKRALQILRKAKRPTIKTHALPDFGLIKPEHRGFADAVLARSAYVCCVRDGRKVMASYYSFLTDFAPQTASSFSEFIRQTDEQGRNRVAQWRDHVRAWIDAPDVITVRFEDVTKDTRATIERLASALGLTLRLRDPVLPKPVNSRVQQRLDRVLGRLRSTNHFPTQRRTRSVGELFTPDDEAFFYQEAGELMAHMGYPTPDHAGAA